MSEKNILKLRILKAQALEQLGKELQAITPYHETWNLPERKHDECIVLASGTSIRDIHADISAYAKNVDFITLNSFMDVSEFDNSKSHIHVLVDAIYFVPPDGSRDMRDDIKEFIRKVRAIEEPFTLAVPYVFYEHAKECYATPYVTLIGLPLNSLLNIPEHLRFPLADMGLVGFNDHTVTISGIGLAIASGYKKIWVAGFDANWFEHSYVDKHCNIRLTYDHYFRPLKEFILPYSMSKHVTGFLGTLQDSENLSAYATWKGVQVINLSLKSHIDVFPKGVIGKEPLPMHVHPSDPNFVK